MKKALGIGLVLIAICVGTSAAQPDFLTPYNVQNIVNWSALYGILSIGVAFVIIAGGIDLSIGSVVALVGVVLSLLLNDLDLSPIVAVPLVLVMAATIGLIHGLLITKLRLQPFIVTLCGLLIYRGLARWLTGDAVQGFGAEKLQTLQTLAGGTIPVPGLEDFRLPVAIFILAGLSLLAGGFLHWTIYGRYLLALGRNEQAARYSGINTDAMTILAYVLCSLLVGVGGVLLSLFVSSVQPSAFGQGWEMYAIAAAVLGGCSLRGGEGSILGVVIGTALIRVIYNATNLLGIPMTLEYVTIGVVILIGVTIDEIMHRISAKRRMRAG